MLALELDVGRINKCIQTPHCKATAIAAFCVVAFHLPFVYCRLRSLSIYFPACCLVGAAVIILVAFQSTFFHVFS